MEEAIAERSFAAGVLVLREVACVSSLLSGDFRGRLSVSLGDVCVAVDAVNDSYCGDIVFENTGVP